MVKTDKNPAGAPIEVFDDLRAQYMRNRPQFYKDITLPFYGYNRPGAKISEGIREKWWLQGMMGGMKAGYDCIQGFLREGLHRRPKEVRRANSHASWRR
jgi:non-heme chloroperoxidase